MEGSYHAQKASKPSKDLRTEISDSQDLFPIKFHRTMAAKAGRVLLAYSGGLGEWI